MQKKFYKKRSELIEEYSRRLKDGQIDATLFLRTMANPKNLLLFSDSQNSILDVEVEISTNTGRTGAPDAIVDEDEVVYRTPPSEV